MIKAFISDCDGTLTDGIYQVDEHGKLLKNFYTRDFHGMWQLSQIGVKIGIISYASDPVIIRQCDRCAKYAHVMTGAKDKVAALHKHFFIDKQCNWEDMCYIGDDVLDIDVMREMGNQGGLIACPSDADSKILQLVKKFEGFQCEKPGGRGAVREFADYVLDLWRRK